MSNYRHWMLLVSAGALASACQLGLDGRACGASEEGGEGACLDGWSCCPGNVCQRECSEPTVPGPHGSTGDTSGGVSIGPKGGKLVAGDARAEIPEGALPEDTELALEVIELPMALPRAREQASLVYALGSPDTHFDDFVRIDLPTTASEISHLMLLELDEDWQPLQGARLLSPDGNGGTVTFSTDHGGIFVVVIVNPLVSLEVSLGAEPYRYSCEVGASSISDPGPNGGQGPVIDTAHGVDVDSPCPWPADAPRLWLAPLLRGFEGNVGPRLGTFDLAAPESIFPVRAQFIASLGEPVSVEDEVPYQTYDSTTAIDPTASPPATFPFNGFQQSPLANGSVTISRLTTVAQAGYSLDSSDGGPFASLYLIELANVTLRASPEEVIPDPRFPLVVIIYNATLTYAY